jgi:hypothetical protein
MIQRDYIMRMIEQLTMALLRIMKLKEAGQLDIAEVEISKAGKMLLGFDMDFLRSLSDEGIITLITQSDSLDAGKCIVTAELLKQDGEIYEVKNGLDASYQSYLKALRFFIEGLTISTQYRTNDYFTKIAFLIGKLSKYVLPVLMQYKLLDYFSMIGAYAQAENILFQLIDSGEKEILRKGIAFYTRLLAKKDSELIRGKLPREEVKEGLRALQKMLPAGG